MEDWIGLGILILLVVVTLIGLKALSKETIRTEDEFEKGAADGSSTSGRVVNVVNGLFNPDVKRGDNAVTEIKRGARRKKRGDGNANAGDEEEKHD